MSLSRLTHPLPTLLLITLLGLSISWAKKPDKPGGGNGGGGKGDSPSYEIIKLDDVGGAYVAGPANSANDINDLGNVVGTVVDVVTGEYVAAFWNFDGYDSELFVLADGQFANGLNNFNETVGSNQDDALYWSSPLDEPVPLPPLWEEPLWEGPACFPYAINDDGIISGSALVPDEQQPGGLTRVAVVWRVTWLDGQLHITGPVELPTLGDSQALALAVSQTDSATGMTSLAGHFYTPGIGNTAAVKWRVQSHADGSITAAGQPLLLAVGDASANGVNDHEVSSGYAAYGEAHIWLGDEPLPLDPDRRPYTRALDVNNGDVVVGTGGAHSLEADALVWPSPTARPILLAKFLPKRNAPFQALWNATAINEMGMIVGEGGNGLANGSYPYVAVPK